MQDLKSIRFIPGTKISHDYDGKNINTFSYRELVDMHARGVDVSIGIPARQNGLVIIDVDVAGPTHKVDGREFWINFCKENAIPETYTVQTPSGGFHFYFRLPMSLNPETFQPPGRLAPGVDVKWNGWVGAPPTPGYQIMNGNITTIQIAPPSLLAYMATLNGGKPVATFDVQTPSLELHRPFTEAQIRDLQNKLDWMQANATLSRDEWRNGIFAIHAGVEDEALEEELITKWTMNRSYAPGDENIAIEMARRAQKHGPIGPGTIFSIIRQVQIRENVPTAAETPFTLQEILDRSRVQHTIAKDGSLKIEPTESNACAILGAIYDEKTLYFDVRQGHYIYKGKPFDDTQLVNMFLPIIQSPVVGLGLEKFRKNAVRDGLDVLMANRERDPHMDYLKGLTWDGVPRVEKFFIDYVGVPDSEYIRLVGKNFWTSLAARGLRPGAKFDSMVVLEGHEGIAKSTLVSAIGGQYTNAPTRKNCFQNLDDLRAMHQSVIVELPELIGLVGMDAETVKAFLAQPWDDIRALYARKSSRNERGFIFVGTTNSDRYLAQAMGVRRFWPVKIPRDVKTIDIHKVKQDRDQLFAEAIVLFREGYQYWEMPKRLLDPIVESKVIKESLAHPIQDVISRMPERFTTYDVYRYLEQGGTIPRGYTNNIRDRIESVLRKEGYEMASEMWTKRETATAALINTLQSVAFSLDALI